MRERYTHAAREAQLEQLQEISTSVTGFINETHSVDKVLGVIQKHQDSPDARHGAKAKAIEAAVDTVQGMLNTRLREAASDAIFVGKKRVSKNHVDRLGSSLNAVRAFGHLEEDVDIEDFYSLLRNLEVRSRVEAGPGRSADEHNIAWLVEELGLHARPPRDNGKHIRLTETTLSAVACSLIKAVWGSAENCNAVVKLGAVPFIRKLLLGDPRDEYATADPPHPELQVCLAMILAEISMHGTLLSNRKQQEDRALKSWLLPDSAPGTASKDTDESQFKPLCGEAQWAMDILLAGCKGALRRNEHALMWAVLLSLERLMSHPTCRQQLLRSGFVPALRNARDFYTSVEGRLPLASPRPYIAPPVITQRPPDFINVQASWALDRCNETVKDRWLSLRTSNSLPELQPSKTGGIQWLAGSPVNRKSLLQRSRASKASTDQIFSTSRKSTSGTGTRLTPKAEDCSFPPLAWLMGEEGVPMESFYRTCDRNFVLLRVNSLLKRFEETSSSLVSPWKAQLAKAKEDADAD
mmetsp:Transcript_42669/g.90903  ORF Transcript_42669/g.90903 Transcript_42669/m.90903 type:complete len:524 (+) Transcript_42669:86-1657(+)